MKYLWMTSCLILLVAACSNFNQKSHDYYFKGHEMRHGIIPVASTSNAAKMIVAVDAIAAKRGKKVFNENCLNCHGAGGRGDGPLSQKGYARPKDLVKLVKTVPNFKFFIMASRFQGKMPGWQNVLTKKELNDLEHYIRSLAE